LHRPRGESRARSRLSLPCTKVQWWRRIPVNIIAINGIASSTRYRRERVFAAATTMRAVPRLLCPPVPHRASLLASIAACLGSFLFSPFGHARDKTDVVVLTNGDRITGEIKTLEFGLLELTTDHMGTLEIEWTSVASIASAVPFDVERIGGERVYGLLGPGADQTLIVSDGARSETIPLAEVSRLAVIEPGFWQRVDGTFSLGYNYTKSNGIAVGNIALTSRYQGERVRATVDVSANRSSSPNTETTEQAQIASTVQFLSDKPRFLLVLNSIERNEQLGIERRIQSGAAMARYLHQSPDSEITGLAGLVLNSERTTAGDDHQRSVEGVVGAQWRIFRFREPEVSLSAQAAVYPSLTESGRYRTGLNVTLRRDLVKDFTINLTLYQSLDSEPPDADQGADNSDYGIVTSVGYKF
jgi:hypothetical protein